MQDAHVMIIYDYDDQDHYLNFQHDGRLSKYQAQEMLLLPSLRFLWLGGCPSSAAPKHPQVAPLSKETQSETNRTSTASEMAALLNTWNAKAQVLHLGRQATFNIIESHLLSKQWAGPSVHGSSHKKKHSNYIFVVQRFQGPMCV